MGADGLVLHADGVGLQYQGIYSHKNIFFATFHFVKRTRFSLINIKMHDNNWKKSMHLDIMS